MLIQFILSNLDFERSDILFRKMIGSLSLEDINFKMFLVLLCDVTNFSLDVIKVKNFKVSIRDILVQILCTLLNKSKFLKLSLFHS